MGWSADRRTTAPRSAPIWAKLSPRTTSTGTSAISHNIKSAQWSSSDDLWTIDAVQTETGKAVRFTTNFLWMCQGYYRHSQGYTPEWPGMEEFKGHIVHPQTWPKDLDYKDKNVIVIGSGATAATIVPAMAADSAPHHGAAAFADLFHSRAQRERARQHPCASWRSTKRGIP